MSEFSLVLQEQHFNLLQYELNSESVSLSHLFASMEDAQQNLQIEDYSVSQNTLDNVSVISLSCFPVVNGSVE